MYLLDIDSFFQQVLPPSWRGKWQAVLIGVLLHPIREIFSVFVSYRRNLSSGFDSNGQVLTLRGGLSAIAGANVDVLSSTAPHMFRIIVPRTLSSSKRTQLKAYAVRHKLSGTSFTLNHQP